jgi:murein DD-endopeptidase MepM/ murein hydrolase activator NlpD
VKATICAIALAAATATASETPTAMATATPAATATAPAAKVTLRPPRLAPGEVLLVEVAAREAPVARLFDRDLRFFPVRAGRWRAFAGLPVEAAPGKVALDVRAGDAAGTAVLEVAPPAWREKRLSVPPQFTEEKPPELAARVEEDRAAFLAAYAQPPAPPAFERPFAWPRRGRVTGRFGDLRTFNGEAQGQHYGTDLPGPVGAPIAAANDGTVVLVRDAWASGLTVVLFHGADLYTAYFHLSAVDVAEGDRVRRGARIGRLGGSGRASGPHLHWAARVGDLYVDPEALLRLTRAWPRAPAR